jgi:hypothetical protein
MQDREKADHRAVTGVSGWDGVVVASRLLLATGAARNSHQLDCGQEG